MPTFEPAQPPVPAGFRARRPTEADLGPLVELYNAVAQQRNLARVTEADLLAHRSGPTWWTDALVLERDDGLLAAYAHFSEATTHGPEVVTWIDGRVDPRATGHGLATFLLARGERRAWVIGQQARPDARVTLCTSNDNGNDRARALYERLGFTAIRHRLAMRIDLEQPRGASPKGWGLTVRAFHLDDAHALWQTMQAGFADHHDFAPTSYEDWRWVLIDRHDDFDPGLWFVAEADGEIVGGILCQVGVPDDPAMGLVRDLAVVPGWRRRGAANALLRAAFGAFSARGLRSAGLDVDDVTLHGALRLYERAGMAPARRIDIYEKLVRQTGGVPATGSRPERSTPSARSASSTSSPR